MRGFAYEVDRVPERLGTNLLQYLDDEFECYMARNEEQKSYTIQQFTNALQEYGAEVKADADGSLAILLTDECKERYFDSRFNRLKKKVSTLTLTAFSTQCMDDMASLFNERYGDVVVDAGEILTLDNWIRYAEPDRWYYLGSVACLK
ncbi:hypothetical protein [Acetivibrio ethanolgignens]|uniref:Uncharacterized protein n=1 Tax=Acetivibrio ethanolgignens TaxID=290052 RepID=A0A0V8QF28_9FIRM|nr:hypothetical protein [Acetivibrio ethanolgignens]KSV59152.1 hypothetical protein ASU35_10370 [Acetivibrio ethanolgignens]